MTLLEQTFTFGLANSLHCLGMCGPLLACSRAGVQADSSYQLGRVFSYTALGALMGWIGAGSGLSTELVRDSSAWLALVFAVFLILSASGAANLLHLGSGSSGTNPGLIARVWRRAAHLPAMRRNLLLGLCTPLIPCGILYLSIGTALLAGSGREGALAMLGFALGSMPGLLLAQFGAGFLHRHLDAGRRQLLFRGMMLAAAGLLAWRGLAQLVAGATCCDA